MKKTKIYSIIIILLFYINNICYSFPLFDSSNFKTESILLYNVNSDSVVFEKNADIQRPPASLTKIMTFIIVNDCMRNSRQKIKIKKELLESLYGTQSSLADLDVNYEYTIYELLMCMMICSGNDAALVLADYFGDGNVNNFINKMNEKALELGCTNTHFVNPHGLHDKNHYTSCKDMLKIINCAMKINSFTNIVRIPSVIINGKKYKNTNRLLDRSDSKYYYKNTKGIKTGYHSEAGFCLSSLSEKNGIKFIGIFMGAPTKSEDGKEISTNYAMKETRDLCESAFDKLMLVNTLFKKVPNITANFDPSGILMIPCNKIYEIKYMMLRENMKKSDINIETHINNISYDNFPIDKNDLLGTIEVKYKDILLKKVDLVASERVDLSLRSIAKSMIKRLFFI